MFKRKTLIVIAVILIILSGGVFLLGKAYVVPILMYHSINPVSSITMKALIVSPQTFDRQMHFLKSHHYNVVPLEYLATLIRYKKNIPPKTIAITFDDGYKDNYVYAFPILKKYNLPATIFLIVNEIGRPQQDRLNWEEIKIMQDSGLITFGSHTLTHPYLPELNSEPELKREISDSKKILEGRLGKNVDSFCYPSGSFNDKVRNLVIRSGYKTAVVSNPGKRFPNDDVFILKRLRISENSRNMFIFAEESSGFYTFIKDLKKEWKEIRRSGRIRNNEN
ncbi:MAG: polysaccharide deacetylase family protein [Candidatus Omnitrophota bacterium]